MRFEELDTVQLVVALPDEGVNASVTGAVVAVFGDHEAYEVEFTDGPETLAITTVLPDQITLVQKHTPSPMHAVAD